MVEYMSLKLCVEEIDGKITKYHDYRRAQYDPDEAEAYKATYNNFKPDKKLIRILLVGRKYVNVAKGSPLFGSGASLGKDNKVVNTRSGLIDDIPVKDFLFDLLSPNPEWREVFPGEVGMF